MTFGDENPGVTKIFALCAIPFFPKFVKPGGLGTRYSPGQNNPAGVLRKEFFQKIWGPILQPFGGVFVILGVKKTLPFHDQGKLKFYFPLNSPSQTGRTPQNLF